MFLISHMNCCFAITWPVESRKKGPGLSPRRAKNATIVATGQIVPPVLPRMTLAPAQIDHIQIDTDHGWF